MDEYDKGEYDKVLKQFRKIVNQANATIKGVMPAISSDIDSIIKNKEKSPSRIENILDTLLSTMDFGIGEKEFLKLNKYYFTFNKDNASCYKKYYEEQKKDYES